MDREKVIAGLTMLADRTNDDTCEGLKCCKIAEDALALIDTQYKLILELQNLISIGTKMMNGDEVE